MSDQSKGDKASKTVRQGGFGASLLNKLPAISRQKRKRQADKTRRQREKGELNDELE